MMAREMAKRNARPPAVEPGFVSSNQKHSKASCRSSIRNWKRVNGHALRARQIVPADRWMTLRYEDLCRDVEAQLRRITEFANVAPYDGPVSFRDSEHHVIGNRMRMSDSREIVLDERWREQLAPGEIALIERSTRRMRELFGYATAVRSISQGRASFNLEPSHYEEVPVNIAKTVIEKRMETSQAK